MTKEEKFEAIDRFSAILQFQLDLKQIRDIIDKVFEIRDKENHSCEYLNSFYEQALFEIKDIVEDIIMIDDESTGSN